MRLRENGVVNIGAAALGLFSGGGGFSSSPSIQSIDLSSLNVQAQTPARTLTARDFARMAPWDNRVQSQPLSAVARSALSSTRLLEVGLGSGPGSSVRDENDRALFTIHNGVRKLQALADAAAQDGVSASDRVKIQERIAKGITELNGHVGATKLDGALLLAGKRLTSMTSDVAGRSSSQYDTKVLATGASGEIPTSFEGDRRFDLTITRLGVPTTMSIDLAGMGATPRTLFNVTGYINSELNAAGFETRFSGVETKLPPPATTGPNAAALAAAATPKYEQRMRLTMGFGETVKFSAAVGDTEPALFVAGAKTVNGTTQSVVAKLTDLSQPLGTTSFANDLTAATGSTATARAIAKGPDGSMFVIADATGKTNGLSPKASRDVMLMKYDTTGQVVWTRALGSAAPAEGFSISVGADGTIAVAGAVDGKADKAATTTGNLRDSFVAAFDKEGRDLWYHQQGANGNDNATHVSVADDGSVFVLGSTTESYGNAATLGGKDVYLQGFSSTGSVNFTTSIGTSGDDAPAGLVLQNGQPLVVWNETGGPRMASYDAANGGPTSSIDTLSSSGLNSVGSVALDESGRLFLAGAAIGNPINDRLVGLDLATNNVLFSTQATNSIRSVTASGGQVAFATEDTVAIPATATAAATTGRETRLVGLSAQTGAAAFNRAAPANATGQVAIAFSGASSKSLDALGLPEGDLLFGDSFSLTDKTGLRAGDNFSVAVNGNTAKKIEIVQGETLRTLAAKLNRVLLRDGKAEVRSVKGVENLVITPNAGDRVELKAGAGVSDALKQLGLDVGVAIPRPPKAAAGTKSVLDPPPVIALEIPIGSDVSDKGKAKILADSFDGVLRRIRIGYREISTDPTQVELRRQTAASSNRNTSSSAGIAYYQQQAAAGQEALRRLGVIA